MTASQLTYVILFSFVTVLCQFRNKYFGDISRGFVDLCGFLGCRSFDLSKGVFTADFQLTKWPLLPHVFSQVDEKLFSLVERLWATSPTEFVRGILTNINLLLWLMALCSLIKITLLVDTKAIKYGHSTLIFRHFLKQKTKVNKKMKWWAYLQCKSSSGWNLFMWRDNRFGCGNPLPHLSQKSVVFFRWTWVMLKVWSIMHQPRSG